MCRKPYQTDPPPTTTTNGFLRSNKSKIMNTNVSVWFVDRGYL